MHGMRVNCQTSFKTAKNSDMRVTFHYSDIAFRVKQATLHKEWLLALIRSEGRKCGKIDYVFVSDRELLQMNQQFLSHDTYTDIITFDYTEGNVLNAEIYISLDRVKENSEKMKISFAEECRRVMAHGVLHLCGYKDKKYEHAKVMRSKEDHYLKKFRP